MVAPRVPLLMIWQSPRTLQISNTFENHHRWFLVRIPIDSQILDCPWISPKLLSTQHVNISTEKLENDQLLRLCIRHGYLHKTRFRFRVPSSVCGRGSGLTVLHRAPKMIHTPSPSHAPCEKCLPLKKTISSGWTRMEIHLRDAIFVLPLCCWIEGWCQQGREKHENCNFFVRPCCDCRFIMQISVPHSRWTWGWWGEDFLQHITESSHNQKGGLGNRSSNDAHAPENISKQTSALPVVGFEPASWSRLVVGPSARDPRGWTHSDLRGPQSFRAFPHQGPGPVSLAWFSPSPPAIYPAREIKILLRVPFTRILHTEKSSAFISNNRSKRTSKQNILQNGG